MNYNYRYITQITIEAKSAFAINSGKLGLLHDNVVLKDANGLPFIPGTSLAGILRHASKEAGVDEKVFGDGGNKGFGSRIIFSPALMVGVNGKVIEGLKNLDFNHGFYSAFKQLPYRDHVKINERGTAVAHAKFDEELVFKGVRFAFEIELIGNEQDEKNWGVLLNLINSPSFRIGSGTRKGHGYFSPVKDQSFQAVYNLTKTEDLDYYLSKTASLNQALPNSKAVHFDESTFNKWEKFTLKIKPKDFFIFGAGYGDEDADRISKKEKFIQWIDERPHLLEDEFVLIPATSIKGALLHRVGFHFNKNSGNITGQPQNVQAPNKAFDFKSIIEKLEGLKNEKAITITSDDELYENLIKEIESFDFVENYKWQDYIKYLEDEGEKVNRTASTLSVENNAINELFGFAKDSENEIKGKKGSVLINDLYIPFLKKNEKVFNHVKVDRFTGGALDGALFQEKSYYHTDSLELEIFVEKSILNDAKVKDAFDQTLEDLISGNLPLGGMTTKGHGFFLGEKILDK